MADKGLYLLGPCFHCALEYRLLTSIYLQVSLCQVFLMEATYVFSRLRVALKAASDFVLRQLSMTVLLLGMREPKYLILANMLSLYV